MQKNYKVFVLNFHNIRFMYKIIAISISSILTFTLFSGCNILLENKINKEVNNDLNHIKNYNHKIFKKENINKLLCMSGVNQYDISNLIKTDKNLKHLKINQYVSWKVNKLGQLLELKWNISRNKNKIYKKINNQFLIFDNTEKNFLINKTVFIKKNSNFLKSALQSGLNQSEIKSVIEAIQWQIDFHKLNIGSNFNLVFLHNVLDKKNFLLGVKLNNFGKKYYSIRSSNGKFYDINGCRKKNSFINSSYLKKYRISSQFNLHRLNPVTHRISKHLGVDLAMPQGTPIFSTSNGKVIKARFNKIAGFYISIKTNNKYVTRYMHLKKILVKLGDRVKIGQKIALSGNTGRTTGPHLHYEIWINNHPINPINSELLFCEQLPEKEKKIYLKESKKILEHLRN